MYPSGKEVGGEGDVRRSERENAGIPPIKLGFTPDFRVLGPGPGPGRGRGVTPKTSKIQGQVSPRSSTSALSTLSLAKRRLQIELDAEKKKAEANMEKAEATAALKMADAESKERMAELQRRLYHAELDEEEEQGIGFSGEEDTGEVEGESGKVNDWIERQGQVGRETQEVHEPSVGQNPVSSIHFNPTEPSTRSIPPIIGNSGNYSTVRSSGYGNATTSGTHPFISNLGTARATGPSWTATGRGGASYFPPIGSQFQPPRGSTPYGGSTNPNFSQNYGNFVHTSVNEEVMKEMVVTLKKLRPCRDLPTFNGDIEDWPRFAADFEHSTKRYEISNVTNLERLNKALKGKALDTVKYLLRHPDNVPSIMKTLELNYGRADLIIEVLMSKAKEFKKIRDDQLELVVEFSTRVRNLVSTIESLQRREHFQNPCLLKELEEKLPSTLKVNWSMRRVSEKRVINIRIFSDWLEEQASGLIYFVKAPSSKVEQKEEKKKKVGRVVATVGLADDDESENRKSKKGSKSKVTCVVCSRVGHEISSCFLFKKKKLSEKKKLIQDKGLCFKCLSENHVAKNCTEKGCEKCELPHHVLIHYEQKAHEEVTTKKSDDDADAKKDSTLDKDVVAKVEINSTNEKLSRILAQIVPITIFGPKKRMDTFAFLDQGAKCSLMDENVMRELGYNLDNKIKVNLSWIDGDCKVKEVSTADVKLCGKGLGEKLILKGVRSFKNLKLPSQSVTKEDLRNWQIDSEKVPIYANARPVLLIGLDNAFIFRVKGCDSKSLVLSNTKLGVTIFGPVSGESGGEHVGGVDLIKEMNTHFICTTGEEPDLHNLVTKYFSTEEFGVKPSNSHVTSREVERATNILENTTQRIEGGWETGLLWKEEEPFLPNSRGEALKRLSTLEKRMDRDPEFGRKYHAKMMEMKEKGFIRLLTSDEKNYAGKVWYLPHFYAPNPKKPEKMRIVFDAKAKAKGRSLNDFLLKGPDFYKSLPEILVKFRQGRVGFSADIKDMFMKIKIRPEDYHCQRLLYRGLERKSPPEEYVITSMTFGSSSSPCSAQFVKNKNAMEFSQEFPEASKAIVENHYVDDYLDSKSSVLAAEQTIKEVTEIHKRGGFTLCGWVSSHPEALSFLPKDLRGDLKTLGFSGSNETERILGLYWKPEDDVFSFRSSFVNVDEDLTNGTKRPTKREVLKVLMSLFDPLGFVAHFTVKGKILLQDIWRSGIGWDDELPNSSFRKWKNWIEDLRKITQVKIPRCYEPEVESAENIQLHVFVDASEQAFSAVTYFRFKFQETVSTSFVMAKTRVAPLRPMTVPRLELQAAVMGSRLAETVKKSHQFVISETHFWSDSTTVLSWIKKDASGFQAFVGNRVGEIQESTSGDVWHWLPTDLNVADEATRDSSTTDFSPGGRWYNGPEFLLSPPQYWPKEKVDPPKLDEDDELMVNLVHETKSLIDFNRFSSFIKLVRMVAWIRNLLMRRRKLLITPEEFRQAELRLWRLVQRESFAEELHNLEAKGQVQKNSKILGLSPFLDEDGLLRVKGRTQLSPDLTQMTKEPIILDSKHRVTTLLIEWYHNKFHHQGQDTVLNELKQRYSIIKPKRAVRKVFHECMRCRMEKPIPITQEMGNLPTTRVTLVKAFTNVGLDYFGPMEVTVGRHREKRYGVLFTCMATRAVHMEVAASLTTDSCILAIRRMVTRRRNPTTITSDRGTNFIGANRELKESFAEGVDTEDLKAKVIEMGLGWKFNPPRAPHMGGAWESLVKSVKVALAATLKERAPKDEVLHTLILEAEHVVNCRPLTYVSEDTNDLEALTPNHFLIGSSSNVPVPGVFTKADLCLRKQWREAQALADIFWRRWVKEYLPTLNKRSKWFTPGVQLKTGDLVFVADDYLARGSWPKGIVTAVFPGKDGQVRVIEVKTSTGVYRRPVTKILVPGGEDWNSQNGNSEGACSVRNQDAK